MTRPGDRTHCPAGHEYTPENTMRERNGKRHCRQCENARTREDMRRKRAAAGGDRQRAYAIRHGKAEGARRYQQWIERQARPRRAPKPPRFTERERAIRTLRTLLGKLFVQRCEAEGLKPDAIEYRLRYQNDARFREREIARTWSRKAAAGNLRTDGRTSRIVHDDGTLTPEVVRRLFAEATHCHYCGEEMTPREKTLDHVVPVSRGGVHGISNAVIACSSCNSAKGTRTPDEWRQGQRVRRGA